jgi:ABC-2 type transport system ATP-binding protein
VFGRPYRELGRPVAKIGSVLGPTGFHPARTARKHLEIVATGAGIDQSRSATAPSTTDVRGDAVASRKSTLAMNTSLPDEGVAVAVLPNGGTVDKDDWARSRQPPNVRLSQRSLHKQR